MQWILQHAGDLVVLAVLALVLGLILRTMIKNRKGGHSGCGCDCARCGCCGMTRK